MICWSIDRVNQWVVSLLLKCSTRSHLGLRYILSLIAIPCDVSFLATSSPSAIEIAVFQLCNLPHLLLPHLNLKENIDNHKSWYWEGVRKKLLIRTFEWRYKAKEWKEKDHKSCSPPLIIGRHYQHEKWVPGHVVGKFWLKMVTSFGPKRGHHSRKIHI